MRGRSGPVSESKFELKTLKVSNDTLNVSWFFLFFLHPQCKLIFLRFFSSHFCPQRKLIFCFFLLIFILNVSWFLLFFFFSFFLYRRSVLQLFGIVRLPDCLIITMMSPVFTTRWKFISLYHFKQKCFLQNSKIPFQRQIVQYSPYWSLIFPPQNHQ